MATIRKNQGPVMVLTYTPIHNDFPFLEGAGGTLTFRVKNWRILTW